MPEAIRFMGDLLPGGWRALRREKSPTGYPSQKILCERFACVTVRSNCWFTRTIPLPERFQNRKASGKIDREQLALYDRFGIEAPLSRFGKPPQRWLRISAQSYNSPADYEYPPRLSKSKRDASEYSRRAAQLSPEHPRHPATHPPIIFWNFAHLFIICCIWANLFSIVFQLRHAHSAAFGDAFAGASRSRSLGWRVRFRVMPQIIASIRLNSFSCFDMS